MAEGLARRCRRGRPAPVRTSVVAERRRGRRHRARERVNPAPARVRSTRTATSAATGARFRLVEVDLDNSVHRCIVNVTYTDRSVTAMSTVDVGGGQLAYTEVGEGRPAVWLHGSGPGATGMSNFGGNLFP